MHIDLDSAMLFNILILTVLHPKTGMHSIAQPMHDLCQEVLQTQRTATAQSVACLVSQSLPTLVCLTL